MRSSRGTGLFALLVVACGAAPSPAPTPAAPAEPAAAPAPSAAPESSSEAPSAATSAESAHAARQAALAQAAEFSMTACVRKAGSNDPCPTPAPPQRGNGPSESKPLPATNGASKATMREGAVSVSGRLSPEIIQRIVRQNLKPIRGCYESALKKAPKLAGRVATKLVIDPSGAVRTAGDNGSDLPDPQAVACVVATFAGLSFPQTEGGIVTVVYPFVFAPP